MDKHSTTVYKQALYHGLWTNTLQQSIDKHSTTYPARYTYGWWYEYMSGYILDKYFVNKSQKYCLWMTSHNSPSKCHFPQSGNFFLRGRDYTDMFTCLLISCHHKYLRIQVRPYLQLISCTICLYKLSITIIFFLIRTEMLLLVNFLNKRSQRNCEILRFTSQLRNLNFFKRFPFTWFKKL